MAYRDQKSALRTLAALANTQGGYFTARQAAETGYGSAHLKYHLEAGNFDRVGRGLYRIPTLPHAEHDDLLRLWLSSRGHDDRPQAVVSHHTALALHELAEFIPTTIHMTVPTSYRKVVPKGCMLHRGLMPARDAQELSSFRVTKPLRTLEDLSRDATFPTEQFERAVGKAVRGGLIGRTEAGALRAARRQVMSEAHPKRRTA
jgi:hypothetical protein